MKSKRNLLICLFLAGIAISAGSLEFWGRIGSGIIVDNPTIQPVIMLLEVEAGGASATDAYYQQELGFRTNLYFAGGDYGLVFEILGRSWWYLNDQIKFGQEYSLFYIVVENLWSVRFGCALSKSLRHFRPDRRNELNISIGMVLVDKLKWPFIPYLSIGFTRRRI